MARSIAITMIATLLSCPLLCAAGESLVAGSAKGEMKRCCCCDKHGEDGSCPTDSRRSHSGHSCQCICGGAVVDDAGAVVVAFDWGWSVPIEPAAVVVGQAIELELRRFSVAAWPDVGMNRGRAICCMFNTYLC
jgi:hypothetical protein